MNTGTRDWIQRDSLVPAARLGAVDRGRILGVHDVVDRRR